MNYGTWKIGGGLFKGFLYIALIGGFVVVAANLVLWLLALFVVVMVVLFVVVGVLALWEMARGRKLNWSALRKKRTPRPTAERHPSEPAP